MTPTQCSLKVWSTKDRSLACFCLLIKALLFFLVKTLLEAIGLFDIFQNVGFVPSPAQEALQGTSGPIVGEACTTRR
jgi:hypothetical protein